MIASPWTDWTSSNSSWPAEKNARSSVFRPRIDPPAPGEPPRTPGSLAGDTAGRSGTAGTCPIAVPPKSGSARTRSSTFMSITERVMAPPLRSIGTQPTLKPDGVRTRRPLNPVFPGFRGLRVRTPSGFNVGCVPIERRGGAMTRSVIDMKVLLLVLALPLFGGTAMGQVPAVPDLPAVSPAKDPGVRGGSPGAGGSIRGLNTDERAFFSAGQDEFEEVQSVQGE